MPVYYLVFEFGPHFLSIDCRKSRNSLFSIFSFCSHIYTPPMSWQAFSLAVWEWPSPACVVHGRANLLLFFHFATPIPLLSLSAFSLPPAVASTAGRSAFTFSYFLAITIPPDVVLPFSYIRGAFCLLSAFTGSVHISGGAVISSKNQARSSRSLSTSSPEARGKPGQQFRHRQLLFVLAPDVQNDPAGVQHDEPVAMGDGVPSYCG